MGALIVVSGTLWFETFLPSITIDTRVKLEAIGELAEVVGGLWDGITEQGYGHIAQVLATLSNWKCDLFGDGQIARHSRTTRATKPQQRK